MSGGTGRRGTARQWWKGLLLAGLLLGAAGCGEPAVREPVLPQPDSVAAWFGESAQARLSGNVLEIRGAIDPDFLRRGGRIWARSGPYFYLFNVRIRELLTEYPDLAAVRAVTTAPGGRELARATLHRGALSTYQWNHALALASLAQTEGTENPRRIENLIRWGEDHTEFRYAE